MTTATKQQPSIAALCRRAKEYHRQYHETGKSQLGFGKQAGICLIKIKQRIQAKADAEGQPRKGKWTAWLQRNWETSSEWAQQYMRIAREWDEHIVPRLAAEPNLSINGARHLLRRVLSKRKRKPKDGEPPRCSDLGCAELSVWDARRGQWQERRRWWRDEQGIRSELGREDGLTYNMPRILADGSDGRKIGAQTSIFDPVLCELAYTRWCPPGGVVLDPFAGGSVRGIVASQMGLDYWGLELREEQCKANRAQLTPENTGKHHPRWLSGDCSEWLPDMPDADFIFSCPPYGNLERYSNDPCDLSTLNYEAFLERYHAIIAAGCARLAEDRYACFVVADFRDKTNSRRRNLVGDTVQAFEAAGLSYHTEVVLVKPTGSKAIHTTRAKETKKQVGVHQNVLVFKKGEPNQVVVPVKRPRLPCIPATPNADVAPPTLHLKSSEDMAEVEAGSVKLLMGGGLYLGKGVPWSEYRKVYEQVYIKEGSRVLRRDGVFVAIQTDQYMGGKCICRKVGLVNLMEEHGWDLILEKTWERKEVDLRGPANSDVMFFRPKGGSIGRGKLNKKHEGLNNGWFRDTWCCGQAHKEHPELIAWPDEICRLIVHACTEQNDLVVDPLAGSGQMLASAYQMGRRAEGYESEEKRVPLLESKGITIIRHDSTQQAPTQAHNNGHKQPHIAAL